MINLQLIPTFFSGPEIGSISILLQEGTDSCLLKELFGPNAISQKDKSPNDKDESHIEKIVDAYKFRKEEERYSRKVSIDEIEKNSHNLNISRYVSTAEDEVPIDLEAVNKSLTSNNEQIEKKTKEHNEFLKELGLKTI